MEAIRAKYTNDAEAVKDALPHAFLSLDEFLQGARVTNPGALAAEFATPTAAANSNTRVVDLLSRTQSELNNAASSFATLEAWLRLCVPAIEDGNNFGVGIVLEAHKLVNDARSEVLGLMKELPDYFKERGAAAEKVAPKASSSSTETETKADESGSKNGAADASKKTSTSTVSEKKTVEAAAHPDCMAHVTAIDVAWYLKLVTTCDRVRSLYACLCDFLEKNQEKISAPKGSGGSGLSMF